MERKLKRKLDLIKVIAYWLTAIAFMLTFLLIPMEENLYIFGLVMSVIGINIVALGTIFYILDI